MKNKIFLSNLNFKTTPQDILDALTAELQPLELSLPCDKVTNKGKGFGFATFKSEADASAAIELLNGKIICGRSIGACYQK